MKTIRFTAEQAAEYLGGIDPKTAQPHVSARSVLGAHRRGELTGGLAIGRRVLWTQQDLDAYLVQCAAAAPR